MADPYIPFGYGSSVMGFPGMPDPSIFATGGFLQRQPPMQFVPPQFPTAQGGAMPQSPQEAADIAESGRWAAGIAPLAALSLRGMPATALALGGLVAPTVGSLFQPAAAAEPPLKPRLNAPTEPSDAVRALQRKLQQEGLYAGPIDGLMGPETQRANAQLQDIESRRAQQRQQDKMLELQKAKTDAEREKIRLQQQQEERVRAEGERSAELVREGSERLKNMQPSFMESYGTPLGYGIGLLLGGGGRFGLGRFMAREQREVAGRANTLSGQMAAGQADDVPARIARVNQFWSEGAPNTQAPFGFQSGRQPFPWATNQNAVPPGQLYAPPTGLAGAVANYGPSAPGALLSLGEMGYGGVNLIHANNELHAAEEELSKPDGATPANVQRVEAARQAVADANFMWRTGQGTLGGTAAGQLEANFSRSRLRPSVLEADAERGRLDALLNPQPPVPAGPPRIPRGQAGAGRFLPWRR
jgi:peptidoglycan hydrolase-like protein with peptidoglycan-binding domain